MNELSEIVSSFIIFPGAMLLSKLFSLIGVKGKEVSNWVKTPAYVIVILLLSVAEYFLCTLACGQYFMCTITFTHPPDNPLKELLFVLLVHRLREPKSVPKALMPLSDGICFV